MKLILTREWRSFQVGESVDVDPDTGDWLLNSGAATDPKKVVAPNTSTSNILENLEDEKEEKPEPKVATPEPPANIERPKKSARIDAWREYAESKKIITKGLSKAQIIAAVEKIEN